MTENADVIFLKTFTNGFKYCFTTCRVSADTISLPIPQLLCARVVPTHGVKIRGDYAMKDREAMAIFVCQNCGICEGEQQNVCLHIPTISIDLPVSGYVLVCASTSAKPLALNSLLLHVTARGAHEYMFFLFRYEAINIIVFLYLWLSDKLS
jgi:hypothetical protein